MSNDKFKANEYCRKKYEIIVSFQTGIADSKTITQVSGRPFFLELPEIETALNLSQLSNLNCRPLCYNI